MTVLQGPTLFLGILSVPQNIRPTLLCSVFSSARSDAGHRLFQDGILSASSWASSWQGRFSPPKTVVMQIGTTCPATTAIEFTLENQLVESVPNHKHLGLVISSDLTWDEHLKGIMSRGSQRIGLLKQMSRYLPPIKYNCQALPILRTTLLWVREPCLARCHSSLCCPESRAPTSKYGKDQYATCRVDDHPEERTPRRTAMAHVTMATCNRLSHAVSPPEKLTNSSCVLVSPRSIC